MSRVPVSAPGKAFLIGEYAVLEGAPALVTAVDVRAVACEPPTEPGRPPTAVVSCAHARVAHYLHARGAGHLRPPPVVDTGGFHLGSRKLGLGSSAAVAAAVVGFHLAEHGLDPRDPEIAADALSLARAAHAEAQGGGGSGADVAAAVLGGTLRFEDGHAEPVELPANLHVRFADAGAPATTSSFLAAVRAARQRAPREHERIVAMLAEAAEAFFAAIGNGTVDASRLKDACRLHVEGLSALERHAKIPILTENIRTILAHAERAGIAAKPSGAGGGDLVALFATEPGVLDGFAADLRRTADLSVLGELSVGAEGLRPEERVPTNSRLAGFFKLSIEERRRAVARSTGLPLERFSDLDAGSLDLHRANHMIENVVGTLELPLAIATNFRINGRDVLVPMAVEEASVVAAASNAAKMVREGGGFVAHSDPPWMIAQIQLCRPAGGPPPEKVAAAVLDAKAELSALADTAHPRLLARGGGTRDIEVRKVADDMVIVHVLVDCRDAMGANLLNTVAETLAPRIERMTGWEARLRILSNLADRRCAHVEARVPPEVLGKGEFDGREVVDLVVSASRMAELDPYRACTHNKGIMNGVDAVVLATGNDWRAMEASVHAFAARDGRYGPLAVWRKGADGWLEGRMTMPAAVGVVGGATRVNPVARLALEILGSPSATELGQIMAAAGLASNLAALRALATEGIQRGHMSLHARSVAMEAGAEPHEVEAVASALVDCGEIKAERAARVLAELRARSAD
ncbi:MAG: hydroxymethylglutaryl-CoA reductase, degradative [Deltaproteobacteria bacterium]|nr:MAG: hydroxymethylglutaryl-CoA reductase, degradative [Deltaproteobacteria bacterium]